MGHGFAKFYEKKLKEYKNKSFNMLGNWNMGRCFNCRIYKFFSKSEIYCIDKNFKFKFKSSRIKFSHCDITNKK